MHLGVNAAGRCGGFKASNCSCPVLGKREPPTSTIHPPFLHWAISNSLPPQHNGCPWAGCILHPRPALRCPERLDGLLRRHPQLLRGRRWAKALGTASVVDGRVERASCPTVGPPPWVMVVYDDWRVEGSGVGWVRGPSRGSPQPGPLTNSLRGSVGFVPHACFMGLACLKAQKAHREPRALPQGHVWAAEPTHSWRLPRLPPPTLGLFHLLGLFIVFRPSTAKPAQH